MSEVLCKTNHLDLVNINPLTKFGQNLSICSKDIEQTCNQGPQLYYKFEKKKHVNLLNMNAYIKFGEILSICSTFVLKILSGSKILTSIKAHNSAMNLRKMTANNLNLDFVNIKAYIKFGQILCICSEDTERKPNSDICSQGP